MQTAPEPLADTLAPLLAAIRPGLEIIDFPAFVVDVHERYRFVNAAYERYFGRASAELLGRTVIEVYGPEPADLRSESLRRALAGESLTFDRQARHGPNAGRWSRLHYSPVRAGDVVAGVVVVLVGVQHLKEAEEAAAARERQLALITDTIGFPVTYVDREGVVRFVNAQAAAWSGMQPHEMAGRSMQALAPPQIAAQTAPLFARALAGETVTYERDALWPGRENRRIRGHMIPDADASGTVRGVIIVLVDIEEDHRLKESLLATTRALREVIDAIPTPLVYVDSEQRYRYVNDAFTLYVARPREEIVGRTVREVLGAERHDALKPVLDRVLGGETVTVTRPIVYFGGPSRWMQIRYTPRRDEAGRVVGYYATTSDIHEQKAVEEELRRAHSVLSAHFENTPLAVVERDPQLRVVRWTGAATAIFGWTASEMQGQSLEDGRFLYEEDAAAAQEMLQRLIAGPAGRATILHRNHRKDGSLAWVEWHHSALRDADGAILSILSLAQDVTLRIRAEERLQFMATHDGLTGLPNRVLLNDRLASAIARAQRSGQRVAVLFLDLDRFKDVNDTYGHRVGDELLRSLAHRIRTTLRQSDVLVRLSGDEFVVLLEGVEDDEGPALVAQKILEEALRPFPIEGQQVQVSASVGYATYPADGKDPETLLKNADSAMYHVKETGRSGHHAFSRTLAQRRERRLSLEEALRRGIRRAEFELHYQPILDVASGRVLHAEALVRWRDPARGLVLPPAFIAVAEEAGLMRDLGRWVLEAAVRQAAQWAGAGLDGFTVNVNLSPSQLRDAAIVAEVGSLLAATGCAPGRLTVEVTETSMVKDVEGVSITLKRLRDLGLRVAIDDFGTGYSSLSHLRHLPVDALKIDRSFVADIRGGGARAGNGGGAAIVAAMAGLARGLGLEVIAEGVEHPRQLDFLREQGCGAYQGYLATPPLPVPTFESWIAGRLA